MIGLKAKQKRFSLYFLEENEIYTQDLSGFCIILDNENQKERLAKKIQIFCFLIIFFRKGKIHICSRSIIFEPDDPSLSIYKYFFRYMKDKPKSSKKIFFKYNFELFS